MIGASSPVTGHKMTIKETATENASIVFTDTDDMVGAYVGMAKGNNEITTGATNIDLVLGTAYTADTHLIANNAIGLTLKNGGNVGIGTQSPVASGYDTGSKKLTVMSTTLNNATSGYLELASRANTNGYNAGAIQFNNAENAGTAGSGTQNRTVGQIRTCLLYTSPSPRD